MASVQGIVGRVFEPLRNFTAGELSPLLDPRADLAFYANGCRILENFYVKSQGTATYRPGSRVIAEVKDSSKKTRGIKFEFSTLQAYHIEAGDLYFRFYKDKGRIESPPGTPVEIATPWKTADLPQIKFTQSADTMYLVHPLYAPRKLTRSSHTSWTLTVVDFQDGPYLDENTDSTKTLVSSAATGTGVTITAVGHTPFASTDVGRLVRLKNGSNWAWAKITAYTDSTHVTADIKGTASMPTSATSSWQLGLWSDTTGWPSAVCFYEERLVFGCNTIRPQRIDGSKSNDFETFTPGTNAGDPISYNIASDQVNAIRWLAPMQDLLPGTQGAEFRVRGDTDSAPITPTNISIKKQTNHGCQDLPPVLTANALLFMQRQARKLRELSYDFAAGGYRSQDMTIRAEHVTKGGVVDMAYAQEPYGIVWAARADGQLLGFTYQRDQQITAWHRHKLGAGPGTAVVESVATVPSSSSDQLWMIVARTYNGVTKRYVEVLEEELAVDGDVFDAFHLDCALAYDGTSSNTLTPGAGADTVGATGVPFTASAAMFSVGDVGREIHYRQLVTAETPLAEEKFNNARATITAYVSTTVVQATIVAAFPSSPAVLPAKSWGLTVTTLSGLSLIGAVTDKVDALIDGVPATGIAVSGGAITLPTPAVKACVGFGYAGTLLPMKLDAGSQIGTAQGQITRIDKVIARFYRSLGAKYGPDLDHLDDIEFRDAAAPFDLPPALFTGDKTITFSGGYSDDGAIVLQQTLPLPCNIIALFPRVTTSTG